MLLIDWFKAERGRGAALARHLAIPASMVTKMAAGAKQVPLDHCPLIQEFTGGAVTCEDLRPDKADYFALIRAQAKPAVAVGDARASNCVRDHAAAAHIARTLRAISRPADHPGYRDNTERPRAGGGR